MLKEDSKQKVWVKKGNMQNQKKQKGNLQLTEHAYLQVSGWWNEARWNTIYKDLRGKFVTVDIKLEIYDIMNDTILTKVTLASSGFRPKAVWKRTNRILIYGLKL